MNLTSFIGAHPKWTINIVHTRMKNGKSNTDPGQESGNKCQIKALANCRVHRLLTISTKVSEDKCTMLYALKCSLSRSKI
jgi:hypothetical protein